MEFGNEPSKISNTSNVHSFLSYKSDAKFKGEYVTNPNCTNSCHTTTEILKKVPHDADKGVVVLIYYMCNK